MKYYIIKGCIRDGEHEYSQTMVCRRKSLNPKIASKLFIDHFSVHDYRILFVDYFHEITKEEYQTLKKYL